MTQRSLINRDASWSGPLRSADCFYFCTIIVGYLMEPCKKDKRMRSGQVLHTCDGVEMSRRQESALKPDCLTQTWSSSEREA